MTPAQVTTIVVGLMILIGGPLYLVGKAMERRTVRKAKAWSVSPAGLQQHAAVAMSRVDSLGPLSQKEHEALLYNILFMTSFQGSISWDGIIAQTAAARQVARQYPKGLPWLTDSNAENPQGASGDTNDPEATAGGSDPEVSTGERDPAARPRH